MTQSVTYNKPILDRLRQGEILTNVPEIVEGVGVDGIAKVHRGFGVIVTPDCDLERDWEKRQQGERSDLTSIALLVGINAQDRNLIPKALWGKVRKADFAGAHAIEACPSSADAANTGFPALVFNFKHLFSLPTGLIYAAIHAGGTQRRTQLLSPYRDHLIQRFCSYFGRVALEENHSFPDE